ncbi:SAM-dependent DNA methyltransferase [Enterorhabdus sp. NM05_H27]|nr:SAM-dependent DNA methyltransferase [Enterorhabdus sp. NM05_H27]
MITGAVKNKVDDVWQKMWEGGITNPVEVISQLTYLMFMRSLDEKDFNAERMEQLAGTPQQYIFPRTPEGQRMRWNVFKDLEPETMLKIVQDEAFPYIKELHDGTPFSSCMESATFGIQNPRTLQKAVTGIEGLMAEFDDDISDLGDLYEYMLDKLSTSGTNGQFRTPKQIRSLMVTLMKPKPRELICDPAMGTAGFLISAVEYLREHYENEMTEADWAIFSGERDGAKQFSGFETDQTMLRISAMNMLLHSVELPDIRYLDSVSKNNTIRGKYDLILANPPFTGSVDAEDIDPSLKAICSTKQTELLFVALFLRMLKKGGRCACIVPNGVLFRSNSKAYQQLRQELVENQKLEAIIFMPSGIFKPYSGVSTAILIFTKTDAGGTDDVWFYNMEGDGFTLDDKRDPDEAHNDIPDIIARWNALENEKTRERKEKSFLVPKQEIVENEYDFSFNKYTAMEYERIEYPPTSEILAELAELNKRIAEGLKELEVLLGDDLNG